MYAIREYKTYDTNKLLALKIVDSKTGEYKDLSVDEVRMTMFNDAAMSRALRIKNVEIDSTGNVRLKNMNPDKRIKYYHQTLVDNLKVNHYIVITKHYQGFVDFIADSMDERQGSVIIGRHTTIGDISTKLGIEDLSTLKIYNAKIEKENDTYRTYLYTPNGYRKLPRIQERASLDELRKDWNITVDEINESGIVVNYIEAKRPIGHAVIPSGISHIEQFGGNVTQLVIPLSVKTLGINCFYEIEDLQSLVIGPGIKDIPDECCYDCSIKELKFSGREERIGEEAFKECTALKSTIVTSAKLICKEAFAYSAISKINLLRAETIENKAFYSCDRLREVVFTEGLKRIGSKAFKGCRQLREVVLPSSIEIIGPEAFKECNKLRRIIIQGNPKIYKDAFPKHANIEFI